MLSGASLQLFNDAGEMVASWISTDEAFEIQRLPIGRYTLREVQAPSGYRTAEDMLLEVADTPELQNFVLINERKPRGSGGGSDHGTSAPQQPSAAVPVSPALTGDILLPGMWAGLACAAGAGIVYLIRRNRRR